MRIAYLSTDPGIAYGGTKGASVHMTEMIGSLAAEGAQVLALVSKVAPEATRAPPGVLIEPLPEFGKRSEAVARLAGEPRRQRWIEQRLEGFGAGLLYERLALHSAAGAGASRRLGIPLVVELNAPLPQEARRYRALEQLPAAERLERVTLAAADLVLAVSPPLVSYARRRGARRVEPSPNAVAVEGPARRPSPNAEPVAVFAGRVRPWHGIEALTEAWRLMGDAAPRLIVVGEPGAAREMLEAAGAEVIGPRPHPEVPRVLAAADIGLAPYAADAPDYFSPLKLFEYMAAGLAVVVGDLPGVRAVVSEDTAVVVPKGDAGALAEAVAGLTGDASRRQRLGRAARELVIAEHTWRRRAQRVLAAAVAAADDRELVAP